MNTLDTIKIDVTVELGSTTMPIHHLLRMGRGAGIELDAAETDPMRIYANQTLVALGDVKIDDGRVKIAVIEKVLRPA